MHLRYVLAYLAFGKEVRRPHDDFDDGLMTIKQLPRAIIHSILNQRNQVRERSFGMGQAGYEIFMPNWYTQWATALRESFGDKERAMDRLEEMTRYRCKPIADDELLRLEGPDLQRIISTSHKGLYQDFRYDLRRADGLPSIAHAFDRTQIIKYHYKPPSNFKDETNLGSGTLSDNITPDSIGIPDLHLRIAKWAREQSKATIQHYHLRPELIAKYGMFFNITLRFDHTCLQLTSPTTMIRQTRRLTSVFGEGSVILLDQQAIRGASLLRQKSMMGDQLAPQLINRYTKLDKILDVGFFGYQGDDFLPFPNESQNSFDRDNQKDEYQLSKRYAILRLAAQSFGRFCDTARNAMTLFTQVRLFRPPSVAQENAREMARNLLPNKLGQALVSSIAFPGDSLDFSFRNSGENLDSQCSETNLFKISSSLVEATSLDELVIADLCIHTPHQELYPLEKFWIQCRGWYPKLTLAYIIVNSKNGVTSRKPNKFDLYQCTELGWRSVRNYFENPDSTFLMSFCHTKKIGTLSPRGPDDDFNIQANHHIDSQTISDVYENSAEKLNILDH